MIRTLKRNIYILILSVIIFAFISCRKKTIVQLKENEYFICSMDPQVMEKQPGPCPICKMPLTKITIDSKQLNVITLNAEQIKLANIKIDTVKISLIGHESMFTGTFAINENATSQISSRVNGRVDKLYNKTPGEEILTGAPLYDLYSRQLMLAEDEFIIATEKAALLGGQRVINAAKNKLLLWGLSDTQVLEIRKSKKSQITNKIYSNVTGIITEINVHEGDFISEGMKLYKLADLNTLWLEVQVYQNEKANIEPGKMAEIIPVGMPEEASEGEVIFVNPELETQSKINIVRISVDNKNKKLRPGMQANVIIKSEEKQAISLPIDAIIRQHDKAIVWIQNDKGGFESKNIITGIENERNVEIIDGLKEGEMVVISGAYLINSEYVFRRGMMPDDMIK